MSPCSIEQALVGSVRHLCDSECFLRAYHPIREFTMFWRDIVMEDPDNTAFPNQVPASRRLMKENLLSGWTCKLVPPTFDDT